MTERVLKYFNYYAVYFCVFFILLDIEQVCVSDCVGQVMHAYSG